MATRQTQRGDEAPADLGLDLAVDLAVDLDRAIARSIFGPVRRLAAMWSALVVLLVVPGWLLAWAGITDALRLPDVASLVLLGWSLPVCLWTARMAVDRSSPRQVWSLWLLVMTTPAVVGIGHLIVDPSELAAMLVDMPLVLCVGGLGLSVVMLDPRLTAALGLWSAAQFVVLSMLAAPYVADLAGPPLLIDMLAGVGPIVRRALVIVAVAGLAALLAGSFRRAQIDLFTAQRSRMAEAHARAQAETERARIAEQSAAKTRFLGALSHEIRTPMQAMCAHAERLAGPGLDTRRQRSARVVIESSRHLLGILEGALDTAREDAGHGSASPARFDPRAVVDEVAELFSARAADAGLTLRVSIAPDVPAAVDSARRRWRQVLINLVSNAIKYTEAGEVHIALAVLDDGGGGQLQAVVSDTGVGFDPGSAGRAFAPFVRQGASADVEGHGLGLSITRDLVERMGGRVHLSSAPDRGSELRFTVPLAAAASDPEAEDAPIAAYPPPAALAALRELAMRGDLGRLGGLLTDAPFDRPELAGFVARISALADDFDDARILRLLERADRSAAPS